MDCTVNHARVSLNTIKTVKKSNIFILVINSQLKHFPIFGQQIIYIVLSPDLLSGDDGIERAQQAGRQHAP